MTYFQKKIGSHYHKWFVDGNTNEKFCLCGVWKDSGQKRAKYHNRSTIYDSIIYHSALEARYAASLDYLKKSGDVIDWERQVKLNLKVNGYHINNYYIDFIVHRKEGWYDWVECKGMEFEPWKTNWKILEATFDIHKRTPDDRLTVVKEANIRYGR